MIIHEFNFSHYYEVVFGMPLEYASDTISNMCEFVIDKSFEEIKLHFGTEDSYVCFMTTTNNLFFIATKDFVLVHGVDFPGINQQVEEALAIAENPSLVQSGERSMEIAWPISPFSELIDFSEMDI